MRKTGLKITLPTRYNGSGLRAGNDTDFWFGDMNANFASYENLADAQLNKMAVSGMDPSQCLKTIHGILITASCRREKKVLMMVI